MGTHGNGIEARAECPVCGSALPKHRRTAWRYSLASILLFLAGGAATVGVFLAPAYTGPYAVLVWTVLFLLSGTTLAAVGYRLPRVRRLACPCGWSETQRRTLRATREREA